MQIFSDQSVFTKSHSFNSLLDFARANAGKWVEIGADELPGPTNQNKQSRIIQAARYRRLKLRTHTKKDAPGKIYVCYEGVGPAE